MSKKYTLNKVNMHLEVIVRGYCNEYYDPLCNIKVQTRMLFSTAIMEKTFKQYYPDLHKVYKEYIKQWDIELNDRYEKE